MWGGQSAMQMQEQKYLRKRNQRMPQALHSSVSKF